MTTFEQFMNERHMSANTVRVYSNIIRGFYAAGDTSPNLTAWISNARLAGASPSKIKGMLAAAKLYAEFLDDADQLISLSKIKAPRVAEPQPHPLPGGIADLDKVLAHCTHPHARLAIALGGFAGTRVAETVSLSTASLITNWTEIVVRGKGDKYRTVPISDNLRPFLPEGHHTKLVPLSNSGARAAISRACTAAGVFRADGSEVSSHDLRATFATAAYEKTKDILTVQRLLGHSEVSQTQAYIGVSKRTLAEAVNF